MKGTQVLSVSDFFDDVFKSLDQGMGLGWIPADFAFYNCAFPPADISMNEDTKALTFSFAVAGYSTDEIQIDFMDDKLVMKLEKNGMDDEKEKYIRRGIKRSKFTGSWDVPFVKYDVDKAEASMKDGILRIRIPCKPEALPKKLRISTS